MLGFKFRKGESFKLSKEEKGEMEPYFNGLTIAVWPIGSTSQLSQRRRSPKPRESIILVRLKVTESIRQMARKLELSRLFQKAFLAFTDLYMIVFELEMSPLKKKNINLQTKYFAILQHFLNREFMQLETQLFEENSQIYFNRKAICYQLYFLETMRYLQVYILFHRSVAIASAC